MLLLLAITTRSCQFMPIPAIFKNKWFKISRSTCLRHSFLTGSDLRCIQCTAAAAWKEGIWVYCADGNLILSISSRIEATRRTTSYDLASGDVHNQIMSSIDQTMTIGQVKDNHWHQARTNLGNKNSLGYFVLCANNYSPHPRDDDVGLTRNMIRVDQIPLVDMFNNSTALSRCVARATMYNCIFLDN